MDFRTLVDGLGFPEAPRWKDGKLWFSDMETCQVMTVDLDGHAEAILQVPRRPAGLGWLPDGRLLIVSKEDRQVLVFDGVELKPYADLSQLASFFCNDMVVDADGRAFVGNFGYDAFLEGDGSSREPHGGEVVRIDLNGKAAIVANELAFPNGSVITPDGRILIVAETLAARLSAFAIHTDGSLGERRSWAAFDERGMEAKVDHLRVEPDGIALDAKGGVWVAAPKPDGKLLRVVEGGHISNEIETDITAYACMLGGAQGTTLFILGKQDGQPGLTGKVLCGEVDIPKAGWP